MITLLADLPADEATQPGSPTGPPARISGWASGRRPKRCWTRCPRGRRTPRCCGRTGVLRGDFARAEDLATAALGQVRGPLREGFLFRLAEIELYRGRFGDAREHAADGLEMARAVGDATRVSR